MVCIKTHRRNKEIEVKQVRELGHIVLMPGDKRASIKLGAVDLPLSHLEMLNDVMAHADRYDAFLETLKRNNERLIVTPFGFYKPIDTMEETLEQIKESASYQSYIKKFARSAKIPQSEAEKLMALDYAA